MRRLVRGAAREPRPKSIFGVTRWRTGEIWAARGWALARAGRRADAEEACAKALEACPEGTRPGLASVLYRIGEARRALHDASQASKDFTRAVDLDREGRYGSLSKLALKSL